MARARGARSGRRVDYQWGGLVVFQTLSKAATTSSFMGSFNLGGAISGTIMRVRGDCIVNMDVGAADDSGVFAVGLIVGTDAAVAVGNTAFPSPVADLDADWLWHGFFALRALSSTQVDNEGGQFSHREIDSKAMRKFKPNENLVAVGAVTVQSGSPTFDCTGAFRALLGS